jgi:hypothetical protein
MNSFNVLASMDGTKALGEMCNCHSDVLDGIQALCPNATSVS